MQSSSARAISALPCKTAGTRRCGTLAPVLWRPFRYDRAVLFDDHLLDRVIGQDEHERQRTPLRLKLRDVDRDQID